MKIKIIDWILDDGFWFVSQKTKKFPKMFICSRAMWNKHSETIKKIVANT